MTSARISTTLGVSEHSLVWVSMRFWGSHGLQMSPQQKQLLSGDAFGGGGRLHRVIFRIWHREGVIMRV